MPAHIQELEPPVHGSPRRRRAVVAIAIPAAAAAVVWGGLGATSAFFTSEATVTGQTVGAATVQIAAGVSEASSPIEVTDLLPGDNAAASIDIDNTGTAAVYYSIALPLTGAGSDLDDSLDVTVTVGSVTETRSLSAWQGGVLQIGEPLDAEDTATADLTISLPETAGNALQGASTEFSAEIVAIQERNTPAPTAGWTSDD